MNNNYTNPADKLLTLGDPREFKSWPDYLEMGIGKEHIPELIRMSIDQELNEADSESLEVWAPLHAWRLLGLHRSTEAIEPLMTLFERDDDWVDGELPEVYGLIGKSAIPSLTEYLSNSSHSLYARATAASSLERIGNKDSEARSECINVIAAELEKYKESDPELNAYLICYLIDLKAVEKASTMEKAFEADCVDESIVGDWEDVQIDLGLKEARTSPPEYRSLFDNIFRPTFSDHGSSLKSFNSIKDKKKVKNKRKSEKLSRKKNRKR